MAPKASGGGRGGGRGGQGVSKAALPPRTPQKGGGLQGPELAYEQEQRQPRWGAQGSARLGSAPPPPPLPPAAVPPPPAEALSTGGANSWACLLGPTLLRPTVALSTLDGSTPAHRTHCCLPPARRSYAEPRPVALRHRSSPPPLPAPSDSLILMALDVVEAGQVGMGSSQPALPARAAAGAGTAAASGKRSQPSRPRTPGALPAGLVPRVGQDARRRHRAAAPARLPPVPVRGCAAGAGRGGGSRGRGSSGRGGRGGAGRVGRAAPGRRQGLFQPRAAGHTPRGAGGGGAPQAAAVLQARTGGGGAGSGGTSHAVGGWGSRAV